MLKVRECSGIVVIYTRCFTACDTVKNAEHSVGYNAFFTVTGHFGLWPQPGSDAAVLLLLQGREFPAWTTYGRVRSAVKHAKVCY